MTEPGPEHIFYDHLLQRQQELPLLRISNEQFWPSLVLLAGLTLLALVRFGTPSRLLRIVQSTFSNQAFQQLGREETNPFKFHSLALTLIFLLNLSFLFYKINSLYKFVLVESSYFIQFLFFLGLVVLVFVLKFLLIRSLGFFTATRRLVAEYTTSSILVCQSFGLFLFPLMVLMEFSPFNPLVFISGAAIVLLAAVLLRWYRGMVMGLLQERIGLLQIFSYFCSLEILPIVVLVKYIIETF